MSSAAATSPRSSVLRTDTLAASIVLLLGLSVLQRAIGFVRSVIAGRWLAPEELGTWDLTFSFLMLAAPWVALGLPGSFGRYVERYRQRGQIKTFVRRTLFTTLVLTTAAVIAMQLAPGFFANLIFADALGPNVMLVAAGLAVVVVYHFALDLLTSLRMIRAVTIIQFTAGTLFALFCVGFLAGWRNDATGMLLAYAGSCGVATLAAAMILFRVWCHLPDDSQPLPQRSLWATLLPFAAWIWLANWIANSFIVADRYMIIHFSGMETSEALAQVGNYHCSRIVPLLLIGVVEMIATATTPHVSRDWEAGRRNLVVARLNLISKLTAFVLIAVSAAFLLVAPPLFEFAFQGKYAGGLAVLPLTLVYSIWFALGALMANYLWCAEKARLASFTVAAGLAANILLNLVLLPRFGLPGAVMATAIANAIAYALLLGVCRRLGMHIDRGVWVAFAATASLALGPLVALATLLAITLITCARDTLLSREEKAALANYLAHLRARCSATFDAWRVPTIR